MTVLLVYARIYFECLANAWRGIRLNLWTLLLPIVLISLFDPLGFLLAPLGWLGGLLWSFALDALFSAYLYFVGEVVGNSTVRISEFSRSIRAYFWAVVNFTFALWILNYLLALGLHGNRNAYAVIAVFWLAVFILLNAAPEVLYLRGTYGAQATLMESLSFIQANWIEWFVPNLLLGGAAYLLLRAAPLPGSVGRFVFNVAIGAMVHIAMVFRGHLFQALTTSSHRQRMFRHRLSL